MQSPVQQNILARIASGSNEVFLLSRWGIWVDDDSIGVGLGWLATTLYGLVGLVFVLGYVRLRPVAFVPLGAIIAGLIYVASFYAYLPPYNSGPADM